MNENLQPQSAPQIDAMLVEYDRNGKHILQQRFYETDENGHRHQISNEVAREQLAPQVEALFSHMAGTLNPAESEAPSYADIYTQLGDKMQEVSKEVSDKRMLHAYMAADDYAEGHDRLSDNPHIADLSGAEKKLFALSQNEKQEHADRITGEGAYDKELNRISDNVRDGIDKEIDERLSDSYAFWSGDEAPISPDTTKPAEEGDEGEGGEGPSPVSPKEPDSPAPAAPSAVEGSAVKAEPAKSSEPEVDHAPKVEVEPAVVDAEAETGAAEKDPDVHLSELKLALKEGLEKYRAEGKSLQDFSQTDEAKQMISEIGSILRAKNLGKEQYRQEMQKLTVELMGEAPQKQRFARARKFGNYMSGLWRKGVDAGRASYNQDTEINPVAIEPVDTGTTRIKHIAHVELDDDGEVKNVELRTESEEDEPTKEAVYKPGQKVQLKYKDGRYAEGQVLDASKVLVAGEGAEEEIEGKIPVSYVEVNGDKKELRIDLVNPAELDRWQAEFAEREKEDSEVDGSDSADKRS